MVKPRLWNEEDETKGAALWTLKHVLVTSLKLLHPFCPFITEEIYDTLTDSSSPLMRQDWPSYDKALDFAEDEAEIEAIKEAVRAIRNIRTEMNVAPSRKAQNYVVTTNDRVRKTFEHSKVFFATLAYASEVFIQEDKTGIADDAVSVAIPDAVIYIPFADLVDIEKEKERLLKEKAKWEAEIKRSEGMLNNDRFISKAPESKVQEERDKLEKNRQMLKQVTDRLEALH
jgi:valyl-tRNA synthetase